MKRTPNTTNLTKNFIESKIAQETIMSKYLNIPVNVINDCINNNHLIPSVFRDDDTNGSMGFAYNKKGRLKVRDFGGFGFFEDIYGTVAYVLSHVYNRQISTNNKQDFYFILKHIATMFSDIIDNKTIDENIDTDVTDGLIKMKTSKPIIEIVPRSWNKQDKTIWNTWNIPLNFLNTHFVVPVEQYYINRKVNDNPKYIYTEKDPCYGYILGQNKSGIVLIKLYFPYRDRQDNSKTKFITNCNVLEGLLNLELNNYDYILITKSSKDRLSISSYLSCHCFYGGAGNKLIIGVVNLPSESYLLKQQEFDYLKNKLNTNGIIISLLDFDKTGRKGAKFMYDTYNIPFIFITHGEFNLPKYKGKDFAELNENYTKQDIINFINETIHYVEYRRKDSIYYSNCEECKYDNFDVPY